MTETEAKIKKIVVPLDGSTVAEQIVPYVKICAEGLGAVVELFKVNDPRVMTPYSPPFQGKDYLERVRAAYLPEPLAVHCLVEVGKPADMIATWYEDDPNCVIAMATNGLAGARRWFVGSVTSRVVQTAANPLLLVRPGEQAPAHPALSAMIIALDGSELAEQVLPYATVLAQKLNLAVTLLRVFEIPIDALQMRGADFAPRLAKRKLELHKEAQDYLALKARELRAGGIDQVVPAILEGSPAAALIDSAEKTPGAMIAMTTHGHSGLNRWVMGSVAEKVVHHAGAPVLLVRGS